MKYGYFDLEKKEYVITNPKTPAPWANYLGSPEYGAIISNNAGGYSFEKSGANGRILRYRFNTNVAVGTLYLPQRYRNSRLLVSFMAAVGKPLDKYRRMPSWYSLYRYFGGICRREV